MSKKSEVTHASKSEVAHASSPADGHATDSTTAAQFVARFTAEAAVSAAADVRPSLNARRLARAAKKIAAIPQKNPKLHAAMVTGRFNLHLLAAIGTLGLELAAALKPTPPDRRKTRVLTPAQKQTTAAAAARLVKAIEAVQPIARALRRLQDIKALGRASDVGESPDSVQDAIETFQAAAPGLLPLLDDAGVDADYRAALARDLAELQAISDAKEERVQEKSDAGQAILEAALALEIGLLFFRGRVNSRLQADPPSQGKALRYLPRKPERRKAAPPSGEAGADDDENGEEPAGDEDTDGEQAEPASQEDAPGSDARSPEATVAADPVNPAASGKAKPAAKELSKSP